MLEYHMSYEWELMYNIEILVHNVVKKMLHYIDDKIVALDICEHIILMCFFQVRCLSM